MLASVASFRIAGLCAANFQAFTPAGAVDLSAVPAHAANLRAQGVTSVFACGTTGEGSKLSVAERKAMLEAWIAAADGLAIIAHVGAESLADARDLAAHAAAAGAVAVGIIPPCYVKPGDVAACIAWVEAIASACPALPVYYCASFRGGARPTARPCPHAARAPAPARPRRARHHTAHPLAHAVASRAPAASPVPLRAPPPPADHIPGMNSVHIRCDIMLARVAAAQAETPARLTNFRGIKFSDADLHVFSSCVAFADGRFDILYGRDEQALGALAMGAKGFIGSTYNYVGRVGVAMIAAFNKGDMPAALAEQRKLQRAVDLLLASGDFGAPGCNVGKAILEARIAGAAWAGPAGPVRLPGSAVTQPEKLRAALDALGFFSW
jgi:dihydrodipicolinate synthase/N-acetylneuraminate lyase